MNEKQTQKCRCCESPDVGSFDAHDQARAAQRRAIEAFNRSAQGGCPPVGATKDTYRVGGAEVLMPSASRVDVLSARVQTAWNEWDKAFCRVAALDAALALSLSSGRAEAKHVIVLAEIINEAKAAAALLYDVKDAVVKECEQAKKEAVNHG